MRWHIQFIVQNERSRWLHLLFLLLTVATVIFISDGKAQGESSSVGKPEVAAGLVDGLYMSNRGTTPFFNPLFIIEKGRFVDPYALLKKIGIRKFIKKYAGRNRYDVYTGFKKTGELSDLQIEVFKLQCPANEYAWDIRITGKYTGPEIETLDLGWRRPGIASPKCLDIFKSIAAPKGLDIQKTDIIVPSGDLVEQITQKIQKKFVPEMDAKIKATASPEMDARVKGGLSQRNDRRRQRNTLNTYQVLSFSEGKESIGIGTYMYQPAGFYPVELFFSFMNEKLEKIVEGERFCLSGGIFLGDNARMVFVQRPFAPLDEDDDGGQRFQVYTHGLSGWKMIYESMPVCSDLYF